MDSILFTNVRVIDGSGEKPFDGEVRVEGGRITAVSKASAPNTNRGAEIVDGGGATLMPGLLDAHSHLSFTNTMDPVETALIPPEDHTLLCMKNARITLDHGVTSCFGAAATKPRLDVVIRDAIAAGEIAGPRLLACSRQLGPTGGFSRAAASSARPAGSTTNACRISAMRRRRCRSAAMARRNSSARPARRAATGST